MYFGDIFKTQCLKWEKVRYNSLYVLIFFFPCSVRKCLRVGGLTHWRWRYILSIDPSKAQEWSGNTSVQLSVTVTKYLRHIANWEGKFMLAWFLSFWPVVACACGSMVAHRGGNGCRRPALQSWPEGEEKQAGAPYPLQRTPQLHSFIPLGTLEGSVTMRKCHRVTI